ncbi:MAG TPA: hypothetical protein VFB20_04340 [Burkholderiales bacterium]|nr:hypothetical protein [Burkholderiales bacterium]
MAEQWYEAVPGDAGILQGDFIIECPLLIWKEEVQLTGTGDDEELEDHFEIIAQDVVVMTQACDLEQRKVHDVVVCALHTLSEARTLWLKSQQPGTGENAWRKYFDRMLSGAVWNLSVLNRGAVNGLQTEHRVVDFHDIATVPLKYLNTIAVKRGPRLRLRPPYREHLSQAFARYFMRVGLPSPVDNPW